MLRAVIATTCLSVVACGSKPEQAPPPPAGTGPSYSPLVANGLRAIADNCKTTKTGQVEQQRCTGQKGETVIETSRDKLVAVTVTLRAMIPENAKVQLAYALKAIIGAAGVDQVTEKVLALAAGNKTDLAIGNAKLEITASGESKIAPVFAVAITWTQQAGS